MVEIVAIVCIVLIAKYAIEKYKNGGSDNKTE